MNSNANSTNYTCHAILHPFVYNLTASYADQRNEATMVFTSIVMFMLAALFFTLNLFSRFSDVSTNLNPTIRLFLSSSLSLFLPVMSYLFSEAKSEGTAVDAMVAAAASYTRSSYSKGGSGSELSLRARTILMWMLLVELLRRKVEAILVNVGVQSYSSIIDRASRIAWLGYLVFYNLSSTGKKAIYGTLWVLAAAKLLQRVAINELLKRSFAYGKNAEQLCWYMDLILRKRKQDQQQLAVTAAREDGGAGPADEAAAELLKRCAYAVMGEEGLEMKVSPEEGCHLVEPKDSSVAIVTVGDIWADKDKDELLRQDPSLKRLCLSFALHKLLRRRFEDHPITDEEASSCRSLIFRGLRGELLQSDDDALWLRREQRKEQSLIFIKVEVDEQRKEDLKATMAALALFQVFDEEIQFLCELYHSVVPVVLSSPFFFLTNYIFFPVVVWAFCLLTFILCANGDVVYAFRSITRDNYILSRGTMNVFRCLLKSVVHFPEALFTAVDLAVTMLLLLTFLYEQVWEFLLSILSSWLMVSLLCEYTAKRHWRESRWITGLIRCILWVRRKLSRPALCFNQWSLLGSGRLSSMALLPSKRAVPIEVKKSIVEYLVAHFVDGNGAPTTATAPLSNGWSTLRSEKHDRFRHLSKACESKSIAEVILTWHIATSLLELKYPLEKKKAPMGAHRKVATTLSRYAAYLVASCPELLPDNTEGTKRVYADAKEKLKEVMGGCWRYHVSLEGTVYSKLLNLAHAEEGQQLQEETKTTMVVHKGAWLGKKLMDMAKGSTSEQDQVAEGSTHEQDQVWELLADLWTELMVYLAPSSGELHVKAHKDALAQGGEFITVLWAMCTHTGIARLAVAPWEEARRASDP